MTGFGEIKINLAETSTSLKRERSKDTMVKLAAENLRSVDFGGLDEPLSEEDINHGAQCSWTQVCVGLKIPVLTLHGGIIERHDLELPGDQNDLFKKVVAQLKGKEARAGHIVTLNDQKFLVVTLVADSLQPNQLIDRNTSFRQIDIAPAEHFAIEKTD